ncbi:DNA alkylation repair protein [Labilibacter sediminis]|nr:DNA alkylation repair protein [Labilibacter sediminis]
MAEALKNMFNKEFIEHLSTIIEDLIDGFNKESFVKGVFNHHWHSLELKERMQHISMVISKQLPKKYKEAVDIILSLTDKAEEHSSEMSFVYMFLPNFIEQFGINHLDISIKAMERITQFTSCEFAVRPFIIKYPEQMMEQMLKWSIHPHQNIRRFSSEGCRSRLPWAMALPELKKDPSPILPILENLKDDESEFVRKSVANNLNDISKDHPDLVLELGKRWMGKSKNTDWIVKHAFRTLLKQGNSKALAMFGYGNLEHISIDDFKLVTPQISFGDHLSFSFKVNNKADEEVLIRLEYAIYYQKANGSLSKKVYKISEKNYTANSQTALIRKQAFKPISTRKFHEGLHQVSLIVNGKELDKSDFTLKF